MSDSTSVNTTALEVVEVAADKIQIGIEYLAVQLGVATEYVWPIMVKKVVYQGVVEGVWTVIGLTAFAFAASYIFRTGVPRMIVKVEESNHHDDGFKEFVLGVALPALPAIIGFCMVCSNLSDAIMHLGNPEYYALENVSNIIRNLKP